MIIMEEKSVIDSEGEKSRKKRIRKQQKEKI